MLSWLYVIAVEWCCLVLLLRAHVMSVMSVYVCVYADVAVPGLLVVGAQGRTAPWVHTDEGPDDMPGEASQLLQQLLLK